MLAVKDLMTRNPKTVLPEAPIHLVLEIMQKGGFRQLPVVVADKLVGIITESDIRLAINFSPDKTERDEEKNKLKGLVVKDLMTHNPLTVSPDTPAYRAAEMMSLFKFGALIVTDEDKVIGIISVTDFLNSFSLTEQKQSSTN